MAEKYNASEVTSHSLMSTCRTHRTGRGLRQSIAQKPVLLTEGHNLFKSFLQLPSIQFLTDVQGSLAFNKHSVPYDLLGQNHSIPSCSSPQLRYETGEFRCEFLNWPVVGGSGCVCVYT